MLWRCLSSWIACASQINLFSAMLSPCVLTHLCHRDSVTGLNSLGRVSLLLSMPLNLCASRGGERSRITCCSSTCNDSSYDRTQPLMHRRPYYERIASVNTFLLIGDYRTLCVESCSALGNQDLMVGRRHNSRGSSWRGASVYQVHIMLATHWRWGSPTASLLGMEYHRLSHTQVLPHLSRPCAPFWLLDVLHTRH